MGDRKQDRGVRAGLRKMFGVSWLEKKSLSSSSSPTRTPQPSMPASSPGSETTRFAPGVSLSTSSSSPRQASDSSGRLNGSPVAGDPGPFTIDTSKLTPDPMAQADRDVTLIVHYRTFGNEQQVLDGAATVLRYLEVRGVGVVSATCNDKSVEPAPAS